MHPLNAPIQRPKFPYRRVALRSMAVVLIILVLAGGDAFFVEPNWIQTTHYALQEPVSAPLKIAQLSDVHTDGIGRRERRVLRLLDAEKPDLIVITGDTVLPERGTYKAAHEFYEQLHAPLGVWFVRGNWENTITIHHERTFYESAGVHLLVNAGANPRADIWLAGMDDAPSGHADFDAAMKLAPAGAFVIALFHSPGYFHQISDRVNLALAGHTHGGQVRIPFVRPFWLPLGCDGFLAGWYQERAARLYVTRGVGMSFFPVRFLCRPEVDFITLIPGTPTGPEARNAPSRVLGASADFGNDIGGRVR
jgi:predicted MPP superfamily phosphohydrolase